MKRIAGLSFAIAVLAGGAFTAERWVTPTASSSFFGALQITDFGVSEPAGIMLASALLFGSTTFWRRRRASRQTSGNFKEVV